MSGRMEKTREALGLWKPEGMKFHGTISHEHKIKDAALVEVEEWETRLAQFECHVEQVIEPTLLARAEAAEATAVLEAGT